MGSPKPETTFAPFEPRRPLLIAVAVMGVWIVVLALPMLAGKWLAGPVSDQFATGYAFRDWSAQYIRQHGAIPLWNPFMFGGLPFVGAMHGDIFYLTSWFRLVLPTEVVMNLGFVLHYIAAGAFTYVLLRVLGVTWVGATVGGMAYELSGIVGSYPAPGHDGKLFVTALFPLALIALVLAVRRNRFAGYPLLALTVGLAVVSPHFQMLYYLLVAAGIFALYLAFGAEERPSPRDAVVRLGGALVAIVVGFGIGMIQVLPFLAYLPYSPRAETYYGFAQATSYAVPWSHVPEFFLAGFSGTTQNHTYWASNPIKLHSEYLGLTVVALAVVGAMDQRRRRLVIWLAGIGGLFLLVSLGAATPFYKIWWSVMPFMKKVRAPGMAFYIVAFVIAGLAAVGAERIERGEGRRHPLSWLAVGGAVLVIAALGGWGNVARAIASAQSSGGVQSVEIARRAAPAIQAGAATSALALLVLALAGVAWLRKRVPLSVLALALPIVVGADLWANARPFWRYSRVADLYAPDSVEQYLTKLEKPYRVLDLGTYQLGGVNQTAILMEHRIPQLLGHHGNELHHFDQLMGGRNEWRYLFMPRVWDLYAINHVLVESGSPFDEQLKRFPSFAESFDTVRTEAPTAVGIATDVYVRRRPVPYARLVPGAVAVSDDVAIPTMLSPRTGFDPARIVILDPAGPVQPAPLTALPDSLPVRATVQHWEPGAMRIELEPAAPTDGYLVVSENWYPDWRATVDGLPSPVVRGDVSLLTVPVRSGSHLIELSFQSDAFERGKWISIVSLLMVGCAFLVPAVRRRRGRE